MDTINVSRNSFDLQGSISESFSLQSTLKIASGAAERRAHLAREKGNFTVGELCTELAKHRGKALSMLYGIELHK